MLKRERGSLPLYKQLEMMIRESIDNGDFSYGDILPAESEYMAKFGISRITIRQAMQLLASEGYVQGRPGKGTIVTKKKIEEALTGIKSFSDEMREHGVEMETLSCKAGYSDTPDYIASILGMENPGRCLKIERVRAAGGIPLVFSTTYIPSSRNLPDDPDLYSDSLYAVLSSKYGIIVAKATGTFEAVLADRETAGMLCIEEGDALFKRTRQSYDQHSDAIGASISFYPGNRYSYSIQL